MKYLCHVLAMYGIGKRRNGGGGRVYIFGTGETGREQIVLYYTSVFDFCDCAAADSLKRGELLISLVWDWVNSEFGVWKSALKSTSWFWLFCFYNLVLEKVRFYGFWVIVLRERSEKIREYALFFRYRKKLSDFLFLVILENFFVENSQNLRETGLWLYKLRLVQE